MPNTGNSNVTEWVELSHCFGTYPEPNRLHVRTPLPAEIGSIGWNPIILEVVGYHSYSGEYTHDFKALCNVNGYDGAWYGSQIMVNDGQNSAPFVYRSSNYYGGSRRVCYAVNKLTCCCQGRIWTRWWNASNYRADYAWGTAASNDNNAQF